MSAARIPTTERLRDHLAGSIEAAIRAAYDVSEADREATPERSSYGDRICGCRWDSGPYDVTCEKHSVDDVAVAAEAAWAWHVQALAAERVRVVEGLVATIKALESEPHGETHLHRLAIGRVLAVVEAARGEATHAR